MNTMLAGPAGTRCQHIQSPTEVHTKSFKFSPNLQLVLSRCRFCQSTSVTLVMMPGIAGVNMRYQASALNRWSWWTRPALCQQKLSRHCQIRHSMTQPLPACACHTHAEYDTQMAWQLRSYMACALSLSCLHDASRRGTMQKPCTIWAVMPSVYRMMCNWHGSQSSIPDLSSSQGSRA